MNAEKKKEWRRAYMREKRQKWREQGRCCQCGAKSDGAYCGECREKARRRTKRCRMKK